MKRLFTSIFILSLLAACDDGEIIVTNFDFEDSTLRFCEGPDRNVIYSTNNNDVFESISLEFNNSGLQVDENGKLLPPQGGEVSFDLSGNNRIVYRIYSNEIPTDYFCNVVPPSTPVVVEEWISGNGATVLIRTSFTDETASSDPDRDGLKNSDEGWDPQGLNHLDTDLDGIPDYLDLDDDGDNVTTRTELANSTNDPVTENGLRDTDEDGIPNYLDSDDDNDNVLTRFEVESGSENNPSSFQTAEGIPNYLNPQQTQELRHEIFINHDIKRNYGYRIIVNNLKFTKQDGSGESIQFETYNFGSLKVSDISFPQCPEMDPNCETSN